MAFGKAYTEQTRLTHTVNSSQSEKDNVLDRSLAFVGNALYRLLLGGGER